MTFAYENQKNKKGYNFVIGCDEAGRGSLAGPVVAAAVILPSIKYKVLGIKDSKLLSPERREELSAQIKQDALWSIGEVSSEVVDEINIHNATLLAMRRAVEGLYSSSGSDSSEGESRRNPTLKFRFSTSSNAKFLIAIDGKFTIPNLKVPQEAIIDGDNKIISIAAASIIAKVYRDEIMKSLHREYPVYDFARHKGYGTLHHRRMIVEHGLSPLHRLSFCSHLISSY